MFVNALYSNQYLINFLKNKRQNMSTNYELSSVSNLPSLQSPLDTERIYCPWKPKAAGKIIQITNTNPFHKCHNIVLNIFMED